MDAEALAGFAMPTRASTFSTKNNKTVSNANALAGNAKPARASAFSSKNNRNVLNADVLAGIAKPARASASVSVGILMSVEAMSGFVPKGQQGLLDAYS